MPGRPVVGHQIHDDRSDDAQLQEDELDLLKVKTPMTANTPISPPSKAVALATPLSDMSSVTTTVIGSGEAAPKSAIGINCQSRSPTFASRSGVAVVTPKVHRATTDWSVGDPDLLTRA